MNAPLRVGVVGLGYIGQLHLRILARSPRAQIVALADIDSERASALARGARTFHDYREMLETVELDAVSICLPDRLHVEAAVAVAATGSAMLLEKPMAHDVEGASLIAEALMVGSARCLVNHVLRHDARYTVVHREADPNRLGEVVHMTAARNSVRSLASRLGSASSILFYLGVHDVDAVQWIARSAILRVFARSVNRFGHATEDALFVNFELANGGIGAIHYSWAWPEGLPAGFNQQLEIVGTRSSASLDTRHDGLSLIGEHGQQSDDTYLWPEVHGQPTGCLRDSVEHFLRAVQLDEPFVQDWRDALSAIEVLDAIRESVARGVEIEVDRNVSSRLRASQRTNP